MRGRPLAYLSAIAATVGALALREAIDPWLDSWLPFITIFAAVAFSVWRGGLGPSVVSAALGFVGASWLFLGADWLAGPWMARQAVALFSFALSCAVIIGFGLLLRRSERALLSERERSRAEALGRADAEREALSQRRLVDAVVQASPALVVVDPEPPIVRLWNPAAERLFGWRAEEVLGRPLPIVPPEKEDECRRCREGALAGANALDVESWRRHRDGSHIDVRLSASALHDGDGQAASVLLVFADARESRRASQANARLAAVMRDAHDAVLGLDLQGRILSANPSALRLLGEPLPGRSLEEFVPEAQRAELHGLLQRVTGAQETVNAETLLHARGGEHVEVQLRLAPMREEDGSVSGLSALMQDISERATAERALRESEAVLRAFTDTAPVMMGVVELTGDGDMLHLFDNPATCRFFGLPPGGTAFGRSSELGGSVEVRRQWQEHYALSAQWGEPVSFEYRVDLPDGLHWFSATVAPAGPGAEGRMRFCYVSEDVTERHVGQSRLEESEQRARLAMQVARLGTWSYEPAGDVLQADERTREIAGLDLLAPAGWTDLLACVHEEDRPRVEAALAAAMSLQEGEDGTAGRGLAAQELRFTHADGTQRWAALRAQALFEGHGRQRTVRSLLGTLFDISQSKQQQEQLQRADRRKDEFLATLAHELRNPLAPLRNGLALLRMSTRGSAAAERPLAVMERQLAHMVRLIDDLLDLARISSDKLDLQRGSVSLADVVQQATETSRPEIDAAGHRFTMLQPARPVLVDGDLTRLTQVVANLLNNAAKYTPPGGRIRLDVMVEGDEAVVAVSDNGIGLAGDERERIFEMFGQVDRSLERTRGGLGIGLAIARRLAEMHGGRLEARSDGPGQGSRFELRLPLLKPAAATSPPPARTPVAAAASGATAPGAEASEGGRVQAAPRRILVADDNADAAESLAELLRILGHEVRTAGDGREALAAAEHFHPEIALLDLGMPRLNGYDAARRLRALPGGAQMLLIALTGWGQDEDRRRSREAGFDAHVVKPVAPDRLESLLRIEPARHETVMG